VPDAEIPDVLAGLDDLSAELVADDHGKLRQPRVADVAVAVRFVEMHVRAADPARPRADAHVLGPEGRLLDLGEVDVRVSPHAGAGHGFAGPALELGHGVVPTGSPLRRELESFHQRTCLRRTSRCAGTPEAE